MIHNIWWTQFSSGSIQLKWVRYSYPPKWSFPSHGIWRKHDAMLQSFDPNQTTQSITPTPGDSVDSLASVFLRFCPLTKEHAGNKHGEMTKKKTAAFPVKYRVTSQKWGRGPADNLEPKLLDGLPWDHLYGPVQTCGSVAAGMLWWISPKATTLPADLHLVPNDPNDKSPNVHSCVFMYVGSYFFRYMYILLLSLL